MMVSPPIGMFSPSAQLRDVGLALRLTLVGGAEHRLVGEVTGQPVPELPAVAVETLVDHQGSRRAHHFHGLGAGLVEVADEQRVGATDFASAALHAVDVVVGDVLDVEQAAVHRDDVGHERRRRVVFVSGHLHYRAHFTAELVARGIAVVPIFPPAFDELLLAIAGGLLE